MLPSRQWALCRRMTPLAYRMPARRASELASSGVEPSAAVPDARAEAIVKTRDLARKRSISACFHPSTWIIFSTNGDTMYRSCSKRRRLLSDCGVVLRQAVVGRGSSFRIVCGPGLQTDQCLNRGKGESVRAAAWKFRYNVEVGGELHWAGRGSGRPDGRRKKGVAISRATLRNWTTAGATWLSRSEAHGQDQFSCHFPSVP